MGLELLFLLLPVAALSGWWLGRRSPKPQQPNPDECSNFSDAYFKGLNYLLNEQNDKAIEIFIRMLEADSETVETHFALASLFLKRGEVDRAIRIHQNLIARPTLSREQRNKALFELGRDYMRAGLLDRAENLFLELVNDANYGKPSMQQLLLIFQQEKEWGRAIEIAQRLVNQGDREMRKTIAQFYCEQVDMHCRSGEKPAAQKALKNAFSEDRNCVRASLLEGLMEMRVGRHRNAIRSFKRIEGQDTDYLPEILKPLRECYEALGQTAEFIQYLEDIVERHATVSILIELVNLLRQYKGEQVAIDYMTAFLRKRPSVRGVARLIEMKLGNGGATQENSDLAILHELMRDISSRKPVYQCQSCGFTGKQMHWQCPSCKSWSTVKPIQGIDGE